MPGSVTSVPPVCAFVSSVGGLVLSLMLTGVGYVNNAWIVYRRPNYEDEFQRGIRGHDCYKKEVVKCLPWDFTNKSAKFPAPFNEVLDASFLVQFAYYIVIIIMASQVFWIAYTLGHCCSLQFSKRMENYKLLFFHLICFPVGLWFILLFIIIFETYFNQIFPAPLVPTENSYTIGHGFWLFFLGGLIPFMAAVYCLFDDQMKQSKAKIQSILLHRHQVPTRNEEEMMPR